MCQTARLTAQSPNATGGRSRNDRKVRTSRSRAIGPSTRAGSMKTSSGPRTAAIISAIPRSPMSTCCSMCTQSRWFSPSVWIGETSPASATSTPSPKSAARFQSARSRRPRRRSRSHPCVKSAAVRVASESTTGGADQAAWASSTPGLCPLQPQQLRDDHALDLVRAFADLEDLLVAEEAGDRELVHEAVAAVDLQRRVGGAVREQAGIELRLRGREAEGLALVLEPGRAVDELASRFDFRRHVRERELHCLELRDRPAELLARLRVRAGEVVRALREPDAHRGDRDAAAVEDLHELPEALAARTEQIPLGHGAVLERELPRVGRMPAELVHRRRDLVAGCPVRDDDVRG